MIAALYALSPVVGLARDPATGPAAAPAAPRTSPEANQFFETKVRPLLAENCFSCHGEKKQKGGLRLDSRAGALKGGKDGVVLAPGKPEASTLITAVAYTDPDLRMPPEERLSPEQVQILAAWVKAGAPWPESAGADRVPLAKGKHRTITDADRAFWSLQPVKDPPAPAVQDAANHTAAHDAAHNADWCRNGIDRFVLARLRAEGLTPAPQADRRALIRRVTFDLHGVPPTPADVEAFVGDPAPDAYERLIDRLLASPRYGERWARHWLDLVRYAESDGFRQDAYRPNVWPYRDYVIKSFNDDKPYGRFVAEQLAGDEIDPRDPTLLVATGYLRQGMYEYNQRDVPKQWSEFLNDLTDVTGDVFLGLSIGCARCHDHKFDPILQSDYYRLQAFFAPVLPRNDLPLATLQEQAAHAKAEAEWQAKTAALRSELAPTEQKALEKAMAGAMKKFEPEMQAILLKPAAARAPLEEQLAQLALRQVYDPGDSAQPKLTGAEKEKYDALKKRMGEFDALRPRPLLKALAVSDVGPVAPPTFLPGDPAHPLRPGGPVVLDGRAPSLPDAAALPASTGRRTALAKWIADPANPLPTRVIANRLWQWHFGRGLVATSSDFGRLGTPPTHPELLDYLARRFVEAGGRFKPMHRLILTSATYRQSALRAAPEVARLKDPDNRWLWRKNTTRLDAEQVRDAMLAVSGEWQPDPLGGPPAEISSPRRSVYTKMLRNTRDPLLDAFDAPEAFGSVPTRNLTTTATQSLLMINGDWPLKRAAAFAARVARETGASDPAALVSAAYRLAYGRAPESDERFAAEEFLARQRAVAGRPPAPSPQAGDAGAASPADRPVTQPMPQRGGQAVLVRGGSAADMLRLPDAAPLAPGDFTVEAFVELESVYENAGVRVIASQWDGKQEHSGWALGVTGEKSKYQPRNLILQRVGAAPEPAPPNGGYEVLASNFQLELHKPYYLGVSFKLQDTTDAGVTFYLKDLSDMDAPLRSAKARHAVTGPCASASPLVIGGRAQWHDGQPAPGTVQGWDGLIDEVRVCKAALRPEQLLYDEGDAGGQAVGHWLLKERPGFFKDSAGRQKDLTRWVAQAGGGPKSAGAPAPSPAIDPALVDFCHVLLNSNEFLYVD